MLYRSSLPLFTAALAALGLTTLGSAIADAERFWAQWRGPHATGVSKHAKPPLEWSETKNIRWKTEIPGTGSGTPVIWGDRIFLLTAVPADAGAAAPVPRGS